MAAVLLLQATPGCADRNAYPSPCTSVPVTVLEARRQTLRADPAPPALIDVDPESDTRIEIGFDDMEADLAVRIREVPMSATGAMALRDVVRSARRRGEVVDARELTVDATASTGTRLAQIALLHEAKALLARALRDGTAHVVRDGRGIDRITVQYYEASDPTGKTRGLRFIADGDVLHDYCATDPAG